MLDLIDGLTVRGEAMFGCILARHRGAHRNSQVVTRKNDNILNHSVLDVLK